MSNEIEKIYQKKTQLEHILLRPDTYIGSVESMSAVLWVLDDEQEEKFVSRNVNYVPGLYKIFDEILVNAADNYQRDKRMDTIKVNINKTSKSISVWNNGKGIPIQIHKEYNIYVPEMIFGHLLTSSNYDDSVKKVTGGRNGYGAKLTNIFSKKFTVETADAKTKKTFKMTWTNNMSKAAECEISPYSGEDFTCITFEPDLKKFGMQDLDDDIVGIMRKRVYDLAGVISQAVKVHLNGKKINIKGFSQYVDMYLGKGEGDSGPKKISDKSTNNERWEIIASVSEGQFQQVSFVNSICTIRGGTHVNMITDQIVDKLSEIVKKKHKNLNVKPFQIKNHLWIFINSSIENPSFDSQTKETLTLKASQFGSRCEISEKFIKDLLKSGILDQAILQAKAKEDAKLAKTLTATKKSRLLGIPKLEDANMAGTKNAEFCTLILTEGDSAKSLAMAGLEVVGRDKFGVFPLKGKLLNVREANTKTLTENQEIQNIIKILGLNFGKKYDNTKNLRYGRLMIMADQDHDGSHIKGLIINFIHHFWPSLIKMNGFLKEFITPIIKATKGKDVLSFYTINDYKVWEQRTGDTVSHWKIKYYKGLGTSTDKEAQEYFKLINKHEISFKYVDNNDDDCIDLAFNKKKADNRKEWLAGFDQNNFVDHTIKQLRYSDFINKELIQFSAADNIRSIPSICDGLKPGQRKILFACFKRNLKNEIKVAQLAGYVAEHSAYHHGEQSLAQTIIGMAQNFVGSNNVNYLMPIGQFGTRSMGGKEAASARYIYTHLNKLTRFLFPEGDDHTLKYLEDDGQYVEPEWYMPIIPTVLINGSEGIGTGWSTAIPSYNPRELVESFKKRLQLEEMEFDEVHPFYKGFVGDIIQSAKGGYTVKGIMNRIRDDSIEISELPIHKWTRDYKNFLEGRMELEQGNKNQVEDIKEYHSGNKIRFVIKCDPQNLDNIVQGEGLEANFKLATTVQTTNMVLFNPEGKIKKYNSTKEIMEEFYGLRLHKYSQRKNFLLSRIERDVEICKNKTRFILAVVKDELHIRNRKRKDLVLDLVNQGYKQMKDMPKILSTKPQYSEPEKEEAPAGDKTEPTPTAGTQEIDKISKEYNYLLNMPMWSLTYEKVEELRKELERLQKEYDQLRNKTIQKMWMDDLDNFLTVLGEEEDKEGVARKKPVIKSDYVSSGNVQEKKAPAKKLTKKKKKNESEDEMDEEDSLGNESFNEGGTDGEEVIPQKKRRDSQGNKPQVQSQKDILTGLVSGAEKKVTQKEKMEQEKPAKPKALSQSQNVVSNEEKKAAPKSAISISQELPPKEKPKATLSESILKYLSRPMLISQSQPNPTPSPAKDSREALLLPLEERLKLREERGDINVFSQAYSRAKLSPLPSQEAKVSPGKRKADDILEELGITSKKFKTSQDGETKSMKSDDDSEIDKILTLADTNKPDLNEKNQKNERKSGKSSNYGMNDKESGDDATKKKPVKRAKKTNDDDFEELENKKTAGKKPKFASQRSKGKKGSDSESDFENDSEIENKKKKQTKPREKVAKKANEEKQPAKRSKKTLKKFSDEESDDLMINLDEKSKNSLLDESEGVGRRSKRAGSQNRKILIESDDSAMRDNGMDEDEEIML